MTIFKRIAFGAALFMLAAAGLYAQASMQPITLSNALTGTVAANPPGISADIITVSSCANFYQNSVGQWLTGLFFDFEYMDVVRVVNNATPCTVQVVRGAGGTHATLHNANTVGWVGQPSWFGGAAFASSGLSGDPTGACIASTMLALPYINIDDGKIFQCLSSGQWIQVGNGTQGSPPSQLQSDFCTGVVTSAQTEYLNDAACASSTTSLAPTVQVSRGTIYGLTVFSSANVVGGSSVDVMTVYKNGAATALTCTIAAGTKTCSDTTHSVSVAPGDQIAYQFVAATSDTAANLGASVEKQ